MKNERSKTGHTSELMLLTSFINQSSYKIITSIKHIKVFYIFVFFCLFQYLHFVLSHSVFCKSIFIISSPTELSLMWLTNQLRHILFIIIRIKWSRPEKNEKRKIGFTPFIKQKTKRKKNSRVISRRKKKCDGQCIHVYTQTHIYITSIFLWINKMSESSYWNYSRIICAYFIIDIRAHMRCPCEHRSNECVYLRMRWWAEQHSGGSEIILWANQHSLLIFISWSKWWGKVIVVRALTATWMVVAPTHKSSAPHTEHSMQTN